VWMPYSNTKIGAYSLDQGGPPQQVLDGHLGRVTALEYFNDNLQLLSGGTDGMILMWGSQRQQQPPIPQQPQSKRQRR